MATSLHDGMNLVAKEFVSARDDERGVLILSQFTGAARELPEAIIVNPYDTDQCAAALQMALSMPATRSEEHTSELQSQSNLVCRLLLEKKKQGIIIPLTGWIRKHSHGNA